MESIYCFLFIQSAAARRSRHRAILGTCPLSFTTLEVRSARGPTRQNSHQKKDPQTINTLTILHEKTSKNSGLEAPKSRSGGILEASWGVLEAFWGVLGSLEPSWGASWEYLEPSGRRLGVVLEASWSRVGGVLKRLGASCGRLGSVLEVCSV